MNIGVFFGSRSPEHEVSIITGEFIISELKKLGYGIVPIYLDKNGYWFVSEKMGSLKTFTTGKIEDRKNDKKIYLDLEASNGKLVFKNKGLGGKKYTVDVAFPAFHGQNGEDGTMQGLFEMFNMPYVGCDVASSAITIDKVLTKLLFQRFDIPTTEFLYFDKNEWNAKRVEFLEIAERDLGWPIFVKPARLGSSIGIAKANNTKELEIAIEVALKYDDKILIEKAVGNLMEITCAVIGGENPRASLIQESIFENDLFTYEDKYLNDGGTQLGNADQKIVIPARLNEELTEEIQSLSIEIFKKFGCSGMVRIDFLFDKENQKYYANEINTLPGTLYHHLWKASGLETGNLLKELIAIAEERHKKKSKFISSMESDILRFANSVKLRIGDEKNI